jgi:tight adherence protein B
MSTALMAGLGAATGLGVTLALAGLTGRRVFRSRARQRRDLGDGRMLLRVTAIALVVLVVLAVTGWIAGGVLAGFAVWAAPRVLGGKRRRDAEIARTEAVASWTEMIRDSIVAASGLEEAIVATETVAPAPIASEVRSLVRRLQHQPLAAALTEFGTRVRHPSADLVVAALLLATRMEASDLSGLLSRLADAIRGDARMRIRVEVGRTKVRTATKVIVGVVTASIVFLAVGNREYLAVYNTPTGQIVLMVIGGVFAFGGWLLERMAAVDLPERFTARAMTAGEDGAW